MDKLYSTCLKSSFSLTRNKSTGHSIINQYFPFVIFVVYVAMFYGINRLVSSYLQLVSFPAAPRKQTVGVMTWELLQTMSATHNWVTAVTTPLWKGHLEKYILRYVDWKHTHMQQHILRSLFSKTEMLQLQKAHFLAIPPHPRKGNIIKTDFLSRSPYPQKKASL